jgi:hypothetical protein
MASYFTGLAAKIGAEAFWREKLLSSKNFSCELEAKSRRTSAEENSYTREQI